MRQTDFSLKELLVELDNLSSLIPMYLLISEIGEISQDNNGEAEEAEIFLKELLESDDSIKQFYAYCYLSIKEIPNEETLVSLGYFRENPANLEVIQKAENALVQRRTGVM